MMKTKTLLFLSIFFLCFSDVYAQQPRQKSGGFQTVSVRRGEGDSQMPIPVGKTLEYFTPEVSQNTSYRLCFSEYINGKKQEDDLSEILFFKLVTGGKVKRFQIVPDISREGHFILFGFLPTGEMIFRHRLSEKNIKFEYLVFNTDIKRFLDTEIPLLVVFEGKVNLDHALKSLKKEATDTLSEIDFKKLISPEFPVKKISVLYYTLKKQE